MNSTKNRGWTQMLRKCKHFLLHQWHPSCKSSYKCGDKSWMRKGPESVYDKWNISVVICDTGIPYLALVCGLLAWGYNTTKQSVRGVITWVQTFSIVTIFSQFINLTRIYSQSWSTQTSDSMEFNCHAIRIRVSRQKLTGIY